MHKEIKLPKCFIISIEGYDNAGKTALAEALYKRFNEVIRENAEGFDVMLFSPSKTHAGRRLKEDYKNKYEFKPGEELAMHMYSIHDTAFYVSETKGTNDLSDIFILDRFADSTIAYAENADYIIGRDYDPVWRWYKRCLKRVDYTIYVDLEEDLYLERLKLKSDKIEHPKERDIEHYRRVTGNYDKIRSMKSFEVGSKRSWNSISSRKLINNVDSFANSIVDWLCFGQYKKFDESDK